MADTPTWTQLKELIGSHPKPPLRARVVETGTTQREATVLFDGAETWYIDDGSRIELTSSESTTILDDHRFETMRGFGGVDSNSWVKLLVQGRLAAYLDDSTGRIIGNEDLDGRPCWIADVSGLRPDDPDSEFRHWVDAETGLILRVARLDDVDAQIQLHDLTFGNVIKPIE